MLTVKKLRNLGNGESRWEFDEDLTAFTLHWCEARHAVWASGSGRARLVKGGRLTVTAPENAEWPELLDAIGGLDASHERAFALTYSIRVIRVHHG